MMGAGAHTAGSRGADRLLRYGALVAGVVAAAAIALASDDPRWLRLGVLAALWAALLAAFTVVRLRRETADGAERAEAMRAVYRLELEREVLARREHELAVESDIRTKVDKESRDELDAVRAELRALRETLSQLLGGEVLVERVALQAQSTRVRSLGESNQQPAASRALGVARAEPVRVPEPVLPEQPAARWRPDVTGQSASLPSRVPDERTDPMLRRPRPQDPKPLEPAAQRPDDTVFGDPSNTWGVPRQPDSGWGAAPEPLARRPLPASADSTGPWPPEPLAGSGGRHQEGWRPTTASPTTSAERNGSGGGSRRAPDVPDSPRTVDDLLAAYGAEVGPRHRRNRHRAE